MRTLVHWCGTWGWPNDRSKHVVRLINKKLVLTWKFCLIIYFSTSWGLYTKKNCHWNLIRMTSSAREDLCKFMVISRWILPRMRNFSDYICRENQYTNFVFSNSFPKIARVWDSVEKMRFIKGGKTDGNIILRMRFACWIPKATNTHSESFIHSFISTQP